MDNQRNLLLAVALSGLLIIGWQFVVNALYPNAPDPSAQQTASQTAPSEADGADAGSTGTGSGSSEASGEEGETVTTAEGPISLERALASEQRIAIESPRIAGSINLVGAQIDDIVLKDYRETVDKDSEPVRLFAPNRTDNQYFAEFGFNVDGKRMLRNAVWTADGEKLTPATPVTLKRTAGGVDYAIKLSIDENYMIAVEQTVDNKSDDAKIIQPIARIKRTSTNATPDEFIVHAGPIGVFGERLNDPHAYHELAELGRWTPEGRADWLGFTDRYWHSALIPGEGDLDTAGFNSLGDDLFLAALVYRADTVAAGGKLSQTTQLFAGAKESLVLDTYEDSGIALFGKAISWGWFEWFEKPFLWLLRTLNGLIGNFGVAIIAMTFIIRGLLFPIAQKQFASMAAMKAVQPKMKAIQERYKDDKQQQQQEIMKLYKEEKVNPLAGCLPLLIQIPIFFALYKVLILAIEMRHEPFIPFWIKDLSAPDPWTFLNLFGVLDFQVAGTLFGIGVLALLLGVTMWLTFKLNPSAMDPVQQQIFNFMPWVLMFVMAPFMAGLLLYWVTSNILTLAQQKYLYSQHPQLRAQAEKEKAEMAQKAEREKAEKAKGKA